MQELTSIDVELPRRRVLKVDPLNRRFVKMGFAKLEALKRESLPVIQNVSLSRRYRTDRSEDKPKYFNEFCEFNYEENQGSNSSLRIKKEIQPLCIYKKPRIKDNPFSFRKKVLPRVSEKKLLNEAQENVFVEGSGADLCSSNAIAANISTASFGESELITFYPNKKVRS